MATPDIQQSILPLDETGGAQTPEAQRLRQARVEQFVAHIPVALDKERQEYPWGRGQFGERRGLHGDDF